MTNDKRQEQMQELIVAAIDCINEGGIEKTSIRNIAAKAKVNSSAISYYFGGRNQLISEALKLTLDNAFDIDDAMIEENDDYQTTLKKILMDWEQGANKYPGITKAHFDDVINNRIEGKTIADRFNSFIDVVYLTLVNHGLVDNKENFKKIKIIFMSFFNSLLMPEIGNYKLGEENLIETLISLL